MRIFYRVIMFIPNQITALVAMALGFIGKVSKLLLKLAGSIFALGSVVIFISDKEGYLIGIILAILSAACFLGQKLFAVLQQGVFTMKNWFSSKM